jgi:hypothetical protein
MADNDNQIDPTYLTELARASRSQAAGLGAKYYPAGSQAQRDYISKQANEEQPSRVEQLFHKQTTRPFNKEANEGGITEAQNLQAQPAGSGTTTKLGKLNVRSGENASASYKKGTERVPGKRGEPEDATVHGGESIIPAGPTDEHKHEIHNWIAGATSQHKGSFRKAAEKAGKSTKEFASEHDEDSGKMGKKARLAETLIGMNKKRRG